MRNWSMSTFGEDLLANPRGGSLYLWDATSGTDERAKLIANAPVSVNSVLVSEKSRHVVALGCTDLSDTFDPMLVRWSEQEDYDVWTPTVTNAAGEYRIQRGTQINQGVYSRGGVLILTDSALYGMVYVGQPYIFSTDILGDGCGSISPHAAKDFNGSLYWMGDGNFFVFNGQVQVLPSSARKYVFSDFNFSQKRKKYSVVSTQNFLRLHGYIHLLILMSVINISRTILLITTGSLAIPTGQHGISGQISLKVSSPQESRLVMPIYIITSPPTHTVLSWEITS